MSAGMNPDVFITIAFAGIALLVALVPLVFIMPQLRREAARVEQHESAARSAATAEYSAAVH